MIFAEVKHDYQRHSFTAKPKLTNRYWLNCSGAGIAASAASRHGRLLSRISLCIRTTAIIPVTGIRSASCFCYVVSMPFGRTNRRFDSRCFTSAFSHTIDYILREAEGESTELSRPPPTTLYVVLSLAAIITRHGFNPDRILTKAVFRLRKTNCPISVPTASTIACGPVF